MVAWAGDGECRLLYLGNLARGDAAQQAVVREKLLALQARSRKDDVPTLTLLPGNELDCGDGADERNALALQQLAELHPSVCALGTRELTLGAQRLRTQSAGMRACWLSLNAHPRHVAVSKSRILTAGPLRIGITAVTLEPGKLPDAALRARVDRAIHRLRAHRCDVVILLGAYDDIQAPLLAALFSGIDIVLGGPAETTPQAYGATVLAPTMRDIPYYGELELAVRDNHLVSWRGQVVGVGKDKG